MAGSNPQHHMSMILKCLPMRRIVRNFMFHGLVSRLHIVVRRSRMHLNWTCKIYEDLVLCVGVSLTRKLAILNW